LIHPRPFVVAFAFALIIPCAAVILFATGKRAFGIGLQRGGSASNLGWAFVMPLFGLLYYAVNSGRLLNWQTPLIVGAVGGFLFGLLLLWIAPAPRRGRNSGVYAVLVMTGYVYGTVVIANQHWDSRPATVSRAEVMGTHTNRGNRRTSYRLLLSPWGPRQEPGEVSVDRSFYERTALGSTVCVSQHDGALGISWYEVARCDAT
jgi:hypothetical protein